MFKESLITCVLCALLYNNTAVVLSLVSFANWFTIIIPILAFHTIAFIVNFIHWFLDTWTTDNETMRKRLEEIK